MNRRVPRQNLTRRYTIIGNGKVSKHFCHYFSTLGIEFNTWSRKQPSQLLQLKIKPSDIVLILISDNAIESFVTNNPYLQQKQLVHFSGTINSGLIAGCHPLMTFTQGLYDLETYQSIPFVCDDGIEFNKLFPKLQNKSFNLPPQDKAYYHAMCVLAGNFSQILMRESSSQLSKNLNLPIDILFPYLLQNTKNFIANPVNSATGPIQRGDFTTVKKHLQALENNALEDIYKSFLKFSNRGVDFSQPKTSVESTPQLLRKTQ